MRNIFLFTFYCLLKSNMDEDGMFFEESDYDLEYSEDSTSESDVNLENQYYCAKCLKEENPKASLTCFHKVLELQGESKGIWGFKALKQIVKVHFKLKNYNETMNNYKELLTYITSAVTKNHAEKSINSILDYTSNSEDVEMLKTFYETTLEALKKGKNERLWFKTNTKLGKIFLERGEYTKLSTIIRQLKQACGYDNSDADLHKGTQLLEIYALEIQMYTEQKKHQHLKEIYEESLKVKSAIPHPIILSIIRECGGKMYLRSGEYEKAYTDFFEAFKNYDESGNPRKLICLKYLLLTSMLMKSAIDPLDSQEAKPYKNKSEIKAMTDMIAANQDNDMKKFEKIFQENKESLMRDHFIQEHITQLLKNFRMKILLILIKPYSKIKIEFIGQELGISEDEAEDLVVSSILDNAISGRIDQVNQTFIMNQQHHSELYRAMEMLADRINTLTLSF